jgi:hypothetical protein
MAWYIFITKADGVAVSESESIPAGLDTNTYEAIDVIERPDWTVKVWNSATRSLNDRLLPTPIDRLDDIQARFLADPDFSAVWNSLTAARKTQLRTGIQRVLGFFFRSHRWRYPGDEVEIG